jgi:hypothetical protein
MLADVADFLQIDYIFDRLDEYDDLGLSIGRSIRHVWDQSAHANRQLVDAFNNAERAAQKFDKTQLEGLVTLSQVQAVAEEYGATLGDDTDKLHVINLITNEWARTNRMAADKLAGHAAMIKDKIRVQDQHAAIEAHQISLGKERTRVTEEETQADEDAAEAQQKLRDDLEESIRAYKEYVEMLEEAQQSNMGLVGSDIAVREAQRGAREAVAEFQEVVGSAKVGTDEYSAAQDKAAKALLDSATAAVEYQVAQAEARGETIGAKEQTALMIEQLDSMASTLDPGSPLRSMLNGYIAELNSIESDIYTRLHIQTGQAPFTPASRGLGTPGPAAGTTSSGSFIPGNTRHTGGPVSPGQVVYPLFGEGFVSNAGGRVISREDMRNSGGSASPGRTVVFQFEGANFYGAPSEQWIEMIRSKIEISEGGEL